MSTKRLKPILFESGAVGPLYGWLMLPKWEHFGDPDGPGDLYLDWEHRFGCLPGDDTLAEMRILGDACAGNYENLKTALKALQAGVDAWKAERNPHEAVKIAVDQNSSVLVSKTYK